ncbi:MAG: hypothetical protein ACR2J8_08675 [Thermomicrobiales bacterium]
MLFGRVEGFIAPPDPADGGLLRLTVTLETGRRIEVIREELVRPLRPIASIDDLAWHADQYTQETVGVHLAQAGWEPIGVGDRPDQEPGAPARSAAYAIRNLN